VKNGIPADFAMMKCKIMSSPGAKPNTCCVCYATLPKEFPKSAKCVINKLLAITARYVNCGTMIPEKVSIIVMIVEYVDSVKD
jgi:hypothetical protein